MSDWSAVHTGVASIEAGLDMDMPGYILPPGSSPIVINGTQSFSSFLGGNITIGVTNGTIDMERLDDMVTRIMVPYYALHQDEDFPTVDPSVARFKPWTPLDIWLREWNLTGPSHRDVRGNHSELIRKQAAASTVLLKNENQALPLKNPRRIAVYGNDAGEVTEGPFNQRQFEFGTLAIGGGSGGAQFTYLISPLEAIKARAAKDNALVEVWLNNTMAMGRDLKPWQARPRPNEPDVCLVFLKSWAAEVSDRESLDLDYDGNQLVEVVAGLCNNTIVTTHSAGINVLPWADHPNVTAILVAHYPGQESGNSIVDVLYGNVNPSGHLPYTIAYNASDYNAHIVTNISRTGTDDWQSYFEEKLKIDYRYFDAESKSDHPLADRPLT
ncbi:putative beta-glucosidase g protein [Ilyonectria robusta]